MFLLDSKNTSRTSFGSAALERHPQHMTLKRSSESSRDTPSKKMRTGKEATSAFTPRPELGPQTLRSSVPVEKGILFMPSCDETSLPLASPAQHTPWTAVPHPLTPPHSPSKYFDPRHPHPVPSTTLELDPERGRVSSDSIPSFDFLFKLSESKGFSVIAHNTIVQAEMDKRELALGVQYEIARGVTKGTWTWDLVTPEKLDELKGSNANAAPKVADVIHCRKVSSLNGDELWLVICFLL